MRDDLMEAVCEFLTMIPDGKVVALPAREDIDLQLEESLIVEYYSR